MRIGTLAPVSREEGVAYPVCSRHMIIVAGSQIDGNRNPKPVLRGSQLLPSIPLVQGLKHVSQHKIVNRYALLRSRLMDSPRF